MLPLLDALRRSWPVDRWATEPQLLAISGGADSVALVRAMVELAPNRDFLFAAHFNHGWRGAESDADEAFVRKLCQSLGLRLEVGTSQAIFKDNLNVDLNDGKSGAALIQKSEEAARKMRYHFLTETAAKLGTQHILTAHTASDRIETLLHNLCRGTGLSGTCTPGLVRSLRAGVFLVRPLIACFRSQIEQYLSDIRQPFRTDSSNQDQSYRRNYVRETVLPILRQAYGPHVDQRLLSFSQITEQTIESQRFQADQFWIEAAALLGSREQANVQERHPQAICVPTFGLLPATWSVVQLAIRNQWHQRGWALQAMTRKHWELIHIYWAGKSVTPLPSMANSQSRSRYPRVILPGRIRLDLRKSWLFLEPLPQPAKRSRKDNHSG